MAILTVIRAAAPPKTLSDGPKLPTSPMVAQQETSDASGRMGMRGVSWMAMFSASIVLLF